jgi:hypothetical protein
MRKRIFSQFQKHKLAYDNHGTIDNYVKSLKGKIISPLEIVWIGVSCVLQ